ncbi:MAG TPA: hypothetical protein VNV15_04805 [Opitutaceae bacterium]|jgi:hypothetical protein|nr:hypothetical protein [Opitutaceae bacterium]
MNPTRLTLPSKLIHGLLVAYFAIACFHASRKASYNWDLLAYLGNAVQLTEHDPAQIEARAYALAAKGMPAENYQALLSSPDGFRQAVAADPEVFSEQLQFYRQRVLYIGLIALGLHAGFEPVACSVFISSFSIFLACLLLQRWFARYASAPVVAMMLVPLYWAFYFYPLAKLSTPDALSLFLVLGGVYCAVELGKPRWALACWALSICARTDCALFIAAFFAINFCLDCPWPAMNRLSSALAAVGALGMAFGLNKITGNSGWVTLFYNSFRAQLIHPITQPPHFAWHDYWPVLRWGSAGFLITPPYTLAIAVAAFGAVAGRLGPGRYNLAAVTAMAALAASAGRQVLFPASDPRYIMPTLTIAVAAGLISLLKALPTPGGSRQP